MAGGPTGTIPVISSTHAPTVLASPAQRITGTLAQGALLGGRYRIAEIVGKGGFGAVYEATDQRFQGRRVVAVKEMSDAYLSPSDKVQAPVNQGMTQAPPPGVYASPGTGTPSSRPPRSFWRYRRCADFSMDNTLSKSITKPAMTSFCLWVLWNFTGKPSTPADCFNCQPVSSSFLQSGHNHNVLRERKRGLDEKCCGRFQ